MIAEEFYDEVEDKEIWLEEREDIGDNCKRGGPHGSPHDTCYVSKFYGSLQK